MAAFSAAFEMTQDCLRPSNGGPLFVLCRQAQLAYLQIPKAACSSIQAALLAIEKPEAYAEIAPTLRETVGKLHTTKDLFEMAAAPPEFLRFTFVRHPLQRVVSHYRNQVNPEGPQPPERMERLKRELAQCGVRQGISFREYVDLILHHPPAAQNRHVLPQVEIVFGPNGLNVDFIGRVEQIERDWAILQRFTAARLPPPQRLNVSDSRPNDPLLQTLSADLLRLLQERYSSDCRLFGYGTGAD